MHAARHHGTTDSLQGLHPGDHVCAVIDAEDHFEAQTAVCLAEGAALGQKLFRFTPAPATTSAAGQNVTLADPTDAFLAGGPLDPATMLNMFATQTAQAHAEGYTGIRLVADMDWLLRHPPTAADIAAFELLLDQAVTELGATVVCAYRPGSFGSAVTEAAAVHPLFAAATAESAPMFRMFNTGGSSWQLTGEIDMACMDAFERAARTAAAQGAVTSLHCGGLEFISAAGLAVISDLARVPVPHPMVVLEAPRIVKHCWHVLGWSSQLPEVTFVDDGVPVTAEATEDSAVGAGGVSGGGR